MKPCQGFQKDLGTGVRICRVSVKDLPRACYLSTVVIGKNGNSSKLIYSGKNQDNISGKQLPTFYLLTLYAALNNIWILNGKNLQKIPSCSILKDHTEMEISFSGVYFYVLNICGAIHSSFSETT